MKPEHDDELVSLARALRETTTGKAPKPDATRAALLRRAPQRANRAVWLMAAAALLMLISVPSAWALYTGYFTPQSERAEPQNPIAVEALRAPRVVPATPEPPTSEMPTAPVELPSVEVPAHEVSTHEVSTHEVSTHEVPAHEVSTPPATDRRAPSRVRPVDAAERATYETAHALHFEARDASGALSAWDAYLARYPAGRFAPEAHYNRALTLVRLGRRDEALDALIPFENGAFGAYRQHEASELRAALGASQ